MASLLGFLAAASTLCADPRPSQPGDGAMLEKNGEVVRVRLIGSEQAGYDVRFERRVPEGWAPAAAFPDGQVWNIYSDWRDSWYAAPHPAKVQKVEMLAGDRLRASAVVDVAGQPWRLADVYSLEHGMVRIDRSFRHGGSGSQTKITLESRLRLPLGTEQRMLIPGVLYNNNPSSTLVGTQISTGPGGLGLYEEHRLPIPMVNVESAMSPQRNAGAASRIYGSLLAMPSKIPQGHRGDDQWWSVGLEYGQGYVDLLSVSGPVATNGKKSQIYGHRHGFDPYDEAYLDVQGPAVFEKTLYVDLGGGIKTGYAFRETLWKAFEVFRPTETPHVPFAEAMRLVAEYAKTRFYRAPADPQAAQARPAGYGLGADNHVLQYGWCGGILGIAYGLLEYADRTGDVAAREQAVQSIEFFVHNAQAEAEGLYYGDYDVRRKRWIAASFDQSVSGISSRQLGDNLEHLASLVELGWRLRLPEADRWLAALHKGGDFLLRSPRYKGIFPRAWTPQGGALGWPASGEPAPRELSTAGAQCLCGLARLAVITGQPKYRDAAVAGMDAYWREFGETLARPFWGGTLDAGGEDKEAGWEMMCAAMDVYAATQDPRFLQMAKDAADWNLTWMYFHAVPLKPESGLLHEHVHTVGWTFISTQNQEIDVFGYFMAPDYYRLGLLCHDERYRQVGRVLFEAATQTLSRPGAMFGPVPGIQAEHYNHTNCTYMGGQPGSWRGSQHSMGIAWTIAAALYGGSRLCDLGPYEFSIKGEEP